METVKMILQLASVRLIVMGALPLLVLHMLLGFFAALSRGEKWDADKALHGCYKAAGLIILSAGLLLVGWGLQDQLTFAGLSLLDVVRSTLLAGVSAYALVVLKDGVKLWHTHHKGAEGDPDLGRLPIEDKLAEMDGVQKDEMEERQNE